MTFITGLSNLGNQNGKIYAQENSQGRRRKKYFRETFKHYADTKGGFKRFIKELEALNGKDYVYAFLAAIEAAAASLALYNVVTPEKTYLNANIEHYDYRRTSRNGVGLLMVDVGLVEIRQVATTTFTQTAQPSGADQVNSGTVQATTPTPTQQSAASSLLN